MKNVIKWISLATVLFTASAVARADSADNFNVRFSPLGLAVGAANLRFDYKLSDNLALGPSVLYWKIEIDDVELKATGFAVNLEYFFEQAFESGWMMDFSLGYADFEATDESGVSGRESADVSAVTGSVIGGYHWFWGNTFNLGLGAGLSFNTIGEIETKDANGNVVDRDDVSPVGLALEANIGFTF